jgi:hypothetical protein
MPRLKDDPKLVKEYQDELNSINNHIYAILVSLSGLMQRAKQDYHEEFLNRREYQGIKSEYLTLIRKTKEDLKRISK